jgi:hypothetical protein
MMLQGFLFAALALAPQITAVEPERPHAERPLTVSVAAGGPVNVCLAPAAGRARCVSVLAERGVARARLAAPYLGRWSITAEAGGQRVSRGLRVLPRGKTVMVLAAGDSLVRNLGFGLRRESPREVAIHTEVSQGRGLTKTDGFDWPSEARRIAARLEPDIAIVFLGGNEGFPIEKVSCCGADWIDLFADKQRAVMRGYAGDGATRV